jgi:hypothetical protein
MGTSAILVIEYDNGMVDHYAAKPDGTLHTVLIELLEASYEYSTNQYDRGNAIIHDLGNHDYMCDHMLNDFMQFFVEYQNTEYKKKMVQFYNDNPHIPAKVHDRWFKQVDVKDIYDYDMQFFIKPHAIAGDRYMIEIEVPANDTTLNLDIFNA